MREFLRFLFVVAAMLMVVVGDVWGQCYYGIDNSVTEINTNKHSEKEWWGTNTYYKFASTTEIGSVNNTYGISKITATITLERTTGGLNATVKLEYSVNGGPWISLGGEKELAGTKVAWETDNKLEVSQNVDIPAGNTVKFRICETKQEEYGGSRKLTISNFNVTIASTMTAIPSSLDFGVINYGGSKPEKDFKVSFSNVGNNISATSNSQHFSVSPSSEAIDCFGEKTFTVIYNPQSAGVHQGGITITSTTGKSTYVSVNGTAKGKPVHTWTGATEFLVDEMIDLASLWETSNKENTPSYAIEKFVAEDETGIDPILNGTSIKLTRAGKLTVKIIQDASEIYSALSTTQEIIIKKRPSNFRWLLGDPLDCYVDDSCDESVLLSRLSDAPMTITSSNTNAVVYQDGKFTAVGAGEAAITVEQGKHYKWEEFTSTYTIRVNKYDMSASLVRGDVVWNELIDNAIIVSHELQDYSVESLNSGIAEYVAGNKIQTYFTEGTAQFRVTRDEDRKYKKLDVTLDLNVKRSDEGCLVLDAPDEVSLEYSVLWQERIYEPASFTGIPGELTFYAYKSNGTAVGNIKVQQYVNSNWIPVKDNLGNEVDIDAATSYRKYGPYELDESATKVRFYNGYGSYWRYFKDVKVTRKTDLTLDVDEDVFYLTQSSDNMDFEGEFDLNWSTCDDKISLVCDNPLFTITPSVIDATTIKNGSTRIRITCNTTDAANLTGELTIFDQEQKKSLTLSCEYLRQWIVWGQYFNNLEADENGNITFISDALNAYAADVNGVPTGTPVEYTLDADAEKIANLETIDGKLCLRIFGVGDGHIIASVPSAVIDGVPHSADAVSHAIRVRREGEPCKFEVMLSERVELNIIDESQWFDVRELNASALKYVAHRDLLGTNYFYVQFSSDNTQSVTEIYQDLKGNEDAEYIHTLPEGTTHLRFVTKTGATGRKYIKNIRVSMKTYLTPDIEQINETIYVNQDFSRVINVAYSDIPLIQNELTQNTTDKLRLTPNQKINNNCGLKEFGSYAYTLTGRWSNPQVVTETLRYYTSAGYDQYIQINIVVIEGDEYVTVQNGEWTDPSTWNKNTIPQSYNRTTIKHEVTISEDANAYGVNMQGGKMHITNTGGLTIFAVGYTTTCTEEDITIDVDKVGAGYLRISPEFKGTMPKAIVNFTTKATLNEGGKSAAWQYIGAPGAEVDMSLVATTVLYLRSEEQGWVRKWSPSAELVPFAGYALTQKEQESFVFKPRIVIGDQEITLTYTSSGMKGDNLWANSYMAPIDIKSLGDDDFVGEVDKTVYLYNSGSWTEWSENKDAISSAAVQPGRYYAIPVGSARALDAAYDQTVIPPMQGVYMKAGEGGGSLTLNYEKHVWNCASNEMNRPLRIAGKNTVEDDYLNTILRVRLQLNSQNSGADRMYLIQDSACTGGYDNGYDAPKQMMSGLMNIYTNEAHGKMEISATDHIDGMYLGFTAGEDEVYTMTFTSLIGEDLYLYDIEKDTLVEMSEGGKYMFSASAHSTNDMRFQVLVNPELSDYLPNGGNNGVTTDVQPIQVQNLWVQDKVVYIANAPINSVLEVYTVGGVLITKYNLGYAPCTLTLSSMPTGVYMLRLNDKVYKFVCK